MPSPVSAIDFFANSRKENAGSTATHKPIRVGYACPTCSLPLFASPSKAGFYCNNQHIFSDYDELVSLGAKKLTVEQMETKQASFIDVKVAVPQETLDGLNKRFGNRTQATIATVLSVLCQAKSFIITMDDIKRLTEKLGVEVTGAAELVGRIHSLNETLRLERDKSALATESNSTTESGGGIAVVFSPATLVKVRERARAANLPVDRFVTENFAQWIENGWI